MKHLHQIKELAEEMIALASNLLYLISEDEAERREMIENAKKTPAGM